MSPLPPLCCTYRNVFVSLVIMQKLVVRWKIMDETLLFTKSFFFSFFILCYYCNDYYQFAILLVSTEAKGYSMMSKGEFKL